jgi:hypothetical protein
MEKNILLSIKNFILLIDHISKSPPAPKSTSSSSSSTFLGSSLTASLGLSLEAAAPAPPKDKEPTFPNPAAITYKIRKDI